MNTMPGNSITAVLSPTADYKVTANVDNQAAFVKAVATNQPSEKALFAKPSAVQVDEALEVVNRAAVFEQRSLSFMVDEASGKSIIKVMDKNTEQLIRQIPSEELLKVAQDIKRLQNEMGQSLGFLIDRQV